LDLDDNDPSDIYLIGLFHLKIGRRRGVFVLEKVGILIVTVILKLQNCSYQ